MSGSLFQSFTSRLRRKKPVNIENIQHLRATAVAPAWVHAQPFLAQLPTRGPIPGAGSVPAERVEPLAQTIFFRVRLGCAPLGGTRLSYHFAGPPLLHSSCSEDVPLPRVSAPGLPSSLQQLLEGHLVQRQIGDQLLQLHVLLFQGLEFLHGVQICPAVLLLPPVIRRRADRQALADFFDLLAPANSVAAWCNFATICSGLCRIRFMLSEFRAALRAAQFSHNTWLSLRGAFHCTSHDCFPSSEKIS